MCFRDLSNGDLFQPCGFKGENEPCIYRKAVLVSNRAVNAICNQDQHWTDFPEHWPVVRIEQKPIPKLEPVEQWVIQFTECLSKIFPDR